jgi:hypothetical protein
LFGLFAFGATCSDAVQVGGALGNVHRNAPSVIVNFFSIFSVLALFVVTTSLAGPLLRDFELRTDELFFSSPMRPHAYLAGRLAAGICAASVIFVVTGLGMLLGAAMPWVDPARLGAFSLTPYAWSFAVILLPNLCFTGAVLSLLAVTTRRLLSVYVGVAGLFALWLGTGIAMRDLRHDTWTGLLDPFAARTLALSTRYWSANDRNTLLPPLDGALLWNRCLWLGLSLVIFGLTFHLFRPERMRITRKATAPKRPIAAEPTQAPRAAPSSSVRNAPVGASPQRATQWLHQFYFDAKGVLFSIPFGVLLCFGLLNLGANAFLLDTMYGTPLLPVTSHMLNAIQGAYVFLLVLIVGFYGGELVYRERTVGIASVTDSMPVPDWLYFTAKAAALVLVVAAFMLFGVLACSVVQLVRGYTHLELGLYLQGSLFIAWPFMLLGIAALFIQVLSNNRFLGYLLFIALMVQQLAFQPLHLEHNLYNYAGLPQLPYSDMNGYGHFLTGWLWYALYWGLFASLLCTFGVLLWVRGQPARWRDRIRSALSRLGRTPRLILCAQLIGWAAVGGYVFYNTNIVNAYLPEDRQLDRRAHYEKTYRSLRDVAQPELIDVRTHVDIFPEQRRVRISGQHTFVNRSDEALRDLHLFVSPVAEIQSLNLPGATLVGEDKDVGYRRYQLGSPLPPGARLELAYELQRAERGFTNDGMPQRGRSILPSTLNENGTFFDSVDLLPHFGYDESRQIVDRAERRRRGLGEVPRAKKLEDTTGYAHTHIAPDADWIQFHTVVSTSHDQIALAPGYLQRTWQDGGRRYFEYHMDRPILGYFCYLSGRWQVKRAHWHDVDLEVYYDAKHPYNVERMIQATRSALDYFSANFSPYQFRQVRILEFPGYATFAQSFANTIPYSEALGFIADIRKPEDIDYIYYVTAHEVAHQWWAHQVIGASVQGQTMLMESLAQYSALMVMEKRYGRPHMRKFLRYELDRYLRERGGELLEELPLMRVENQPYIHYQKGSLVFYRLREEIGEEALNRALRRFVADKAFQQAPFTTSGELLGYLRAETPPDKQPLLEELFTRIVFYDNRVTKLHAARRPDGKYAIAMEVFSEKREADGLGREHLLPVDDWMDIGVFARDQRSSDADERVLYLERHRINAQHTRLDLVVDAAPTEVGIDPYNKLLDRAADDNRMGFK